MPKKKAMLEKKAMPEKKANAKKKAIPKKKRNTKKKAMPKKIKGNLVLRLIFPKTPLSMVSFSKMDKLMNSPNQRGETSFFTKDTPPSGVPIPKLFPELSYM